MHKFRIEATFSLETSIEPDGVRFDEGDTEDFEDNSYFGVENVETSGGELSFTVEAEDEHDAEAKAHEVVDEGDEVEDQNGFTWLVSSLSLSVEQIEEEMTLAKALVILKALFARLGENYQITEEEQAAFAFFLDYVAKQAA